MIGQTSTTRALVDDLLDRLAADPDLRRQVLASPATALPTDSLAAPAGGDQVGGYMRPPNCTMTCTNTCPRVTGCKVTF